MITKLENYKGTKVFSKLLGKPTGNSEYRLFAYKNEWWIEHKYIFKKK